MKFETKRARRWQLSMPPNRSRLKSKTTFEARIWLLDCLYSERVLGLFSNQSKTILKCQYRFRIAFSWDLLLSLDENDLFKWEVWIDGALKWDACRFFERRTYHYTDANGAWKNTITQNDLCLFKGRQELDL